MAYEEFDYNDLEKAVNNYPNDEDKINYISQEILRCRNTAYDIEKEFRKLSLEPVIITTNNSNINKEIKTALDNSRSFRQELENDILTLALNKLTEPYYDYTARAEELKKFFSDSLDLKLKVKYANGQSEKNIISKRNTNNKIVWKVGKEKLLNLYKVLTENEILPAYTEDEILIHYLDERRNKLTFIEKPFEAFCWQDSDNSFSVFVDELAKRGAIDNARKDKIMSDHFVNKKGESFKGLAQKRRYTENTTNTGNLVREILDSINL